MTAISALLPARSTFWLTERSPSGRLARHTPVDLASGRTVRYAAIEIIIQALLPEGAILPEPVWIKHFAESPPFFPSFDRN